MTVIITFLVVLSALVFVHEFGHFVVARAAGMKVEEFGFGFPPRLFCVVRHGTTYSINWIPLGGFVKIKGESGEGAFETDSFINKKPWQRFLVLIAGVAMNFAFAWFLFFVGFMVGMPGAVSEDLSSSARVRNESITIVEVLPDSPAARAGIKAGDEIVSIDCRVFGKDTQAKDYFAQNGSKGVSLIVLEESGEYKTSSLVSEQLNGLGGEGVGIGFISTGVVSYPFFHAVFRSAIATFETTVQIVVSFCSYIWSIVANSDVAIDLSGPIGIAVMTGQVAAMGYIYLLQFTAILSLNLAIINMFPFPALDGGRMLFLLIEKLRGRSLGARFEAAAHNLGFILLMCLVAVVTFKDLANFSGEIFKAIT